MIIRSPFKRSSAASFGTAPAPAPAVAQSPAAVYAPLIGAPPSMSDANAILAYEADLARHANRSGRTAEQIVQGSAPGAGAGAGGIDFSLTMPQYPPKPDELTHAPFLAQTAGDNIIVSGNGGTQIEIFELMLWNVTSQTIRLLDGDQDLIGPLTSFPDAGGYQLSDTGRPHFKLRAGKPFIINLSTGTALSGYVRYRMIAS